MMRQRGFRGGPRFCCALCLTLVHVCAAQNVLQDKRYDKGNRFEGTAPAPAGDFALEIVSLTGYLEVFKPNTTLKVNFFLPTADNKAQIIAGELSVEKQYFMKSKQGSTTSQWRSGAWNEFSPWPTKDVIDQMGIAASNLGVLVELAPNLGLRRFTPAVVCSNQCPSTIETYRIMLRPGRRITEVQYRISKPAGAEVSAGTMPVADTLDQSPIPLLLRAAELPEGELRVEISPRVKNRSQLEPAIEFFLYSHSMTR